MYFFRIININLKSVIGISQAVVKNMIKNNIKGSIVNISSQASKVCKRNLKLLLLGPFPSNTILAFTKLIPSHDDLVASDKSRKKISAGTNFRLTDMDPLGTYPIKDLAWRYVCECVWYWCIIHRDILIILWLYLKNGNLKCIYVCIVYICHKFIMYYHKFICELKYLKEYYTIYLVRSSLV